MSRFMLIVILLTLLLACEVKQQQQTVNGVGNGNFAVNGTVNETVPEDDQDEVCGTADPTQEEIQSLNQAIAAFRNNAQPVQRVQPITIPVHIFVIRNGDARSAVSAEQVDRMIVLLNENIGKTKFIFKLESRKEITDHPEWYKMSARSEAELTAKRTLRVEGKDTLNIWTADPGKNRNDNQLTGYAVRCGSGSTHCNPIRDGVVIAPWRVTTATSVHETGHWLGLFHVFEGGCSETNDGVADTTQQKNKGKGCPRNQDTCPDAGNDPVTNYLNYGTCRTELTVGQHERMELLSLIGRASTPLFNSDLLPD